MSANHEAQRQRIVQHAVEAFARIGYASASMAQLASACEVSKATLYHYFASKDAILFEALNAYTARLLALVQAVRARNLSPKSTVTEIVTALAVDYADARAFQVSLLIDVKFLPETQRDQIKFQERAVVEEVAQALELAYPERVNTHQRKAVTMALLGMVNFSFSWFRPDGPISTQEFAQLLSQLWHQALSADVVHFDPLHSTEQRLLNV
jgi:AcrR family transcriptional regulator